MRSGRRLLACRPARAQFASTGRSDAGRSVAPLLSVWFARAIAALRWRSGCLTGFAGGYVTGQRNGSRLPHSSPQRHRSRTRPVAPRGPVRPTCLRRATPRRRADRASPYRQPLPRRRPPDATTGRPGRPRRAQAPRRRVRHRVERRRASPVVQVLSRPSGAQVFLDEPAGWHARRCRSAMSPPARTACGSSCPATSAGRPPSR